MKFLKYMPSLIFLLGFQGWILSFPLFGPVLYSFASMRHIDPAPFVYLFLLFLSLSYAVWGWALNNRDFSCHLLRLVLFAVLGLCLFTGLALLWLPVSLWFLPFIGEH